MSDFYFIIHFALLIFQSAAIIFLTIKIKKMDERLQALSDAVTKDTAVEQSAITLLNGLSQQLKDALMQKFPVQAVQDIVTAIDASSTGLAAAVAANTPAPAAPQQ